MIFVPGYKDFVKIVIAVTHIYNYTVCINPWEETMSGYQKYAMHRVITVRELVTADYIDNNIITGLNDVHSHEEAWELLFCKAGILRVYCGNEWYDLSSNECFFVRPGCAHDVAVSSKDTQAFVISFICSSSEYLFPLEHHIIRSMEKYVKLIDLINEELSAAFRVETVNIHLSDFHKADDPPFGAEQIICSYLEELMIFMLRDEIRHENIASRTELKTAVKSFLISKVDTYIKENYDKSSLNVSTAARHFHYSRTSFSAMYKRETGHSLSDVIEDVRIRKAKELLEETGKTVAEISAESGFSSPQYFTNKFKKLTGSSPTEYRLEMTAL